MNRKMPMIATALLGLCAVTTLAVWAVGPLAGGSPPAHARPVAPPLPSSPTNDQVAIDALFADAEMVGETRALLVLRNGAIVAERYGAGYGPDSKLISWSMAKSITAVLAGLLVADGRLALDEPVPVPGWQRSGDPRGAITLRQMLHMTDGLAHIETGDPAWEADTVTMLFGDAVGDMAGFAESKPLAARPGEQFNYSSATSVILADVLTRSLTSSNDPRVRRDAMRGFIAERLAGPLGMTSLTPEFDARGTMIGGSIMHATARDYARFGEFLRLRGVVAGQQLLPERWVDFMLASSPMNPGYGGHIWLNRPQPPGEDAALWPQRGPADLFAAIGHQGQYIIVSPSQALTVVRLGATRDGQFPALRARLADVVAAY